MIAAYIRVSTSKQETDNQRKAIEDYAKDKGITIDTWVEETLSGRTRFRNRKVWDLVESFSKGDILIITKVSRIGRNMLDVAGFLGDLEYRGISVISINENFTLDGSILSRTLFHQMAFVSDWEVENTRVNTRMALKAKKSKGVVLGRPNGTKGSYKLRGREELVNSLVEDGLSVDEIAKELEVSTATVYRFLK